MKTDTKPRNPLLAAFLSLLIPGLGQLYCGRVVRALAIASIGSLLILLMGVFIRSENVMVAFAYETFAGVLFSIAVTVDAWLVAGKSASDYRPDERNRISGYIWFSVLILSCSFLIALLEAGRVKEQLRSYRIVGVSMNPTLLEGDNILVDHEPYLETDPVRGELVIFQSPTKRTQQWVSRVIGGPGQTVEIRNGKLIVDGNAIGSENSDGIKTERIGQYSYQVNGMNDVEDFGPVTVPRHHIFLMSDNRNRCFDSRHFDSIAITSVDGKLRHRYFPRSRAGAVKQPE